MAIFYRVVDGEKFEKSRSREVQKMSWVAVPNKLDGDGFSTLLDHPNGAAHYGAWMVILLVASKCEPRWTLTRDGVRPHDSTSLARISGIPKNVFDEVLVRLTENEVGWLETVDENWQQVTTGRQQVVPTCRPDGNSSCSITLQDKTEQNRTEQDKTINPPTPHGGRSKVISVDIPPGLDTPEFRKAFDDWREFKRERGQAYKPTGLRTLLRQLAAWGPVKSIQSIEHSMASNYAGLFEPRAGPGSGADLFGGLRDFVNSGGES